MRTTLLAAITLLAFGSTEAAATAADTSRAAPGPDRAAAPAEYPVPSLNQGTRVEMQLGGSTRYGDRYQERYDDRYQDQYGRLGVRVWMDGERDLYRVGDRSRVFVRTERDAYVAVLHIDTNGDVEVLFPTSPSDDGYLRAGRAYSVRPRGSDYLSVRGGYGIGYVLAVASDEPLDSRVLRDLWYRRAGNWDAEYNVYGDPFRAMDRFERMLVRDWGYSEHESSYYSYHVGRRYTHPRYACYDSYGPWYSSRNSYYDSCDRVRVLLVQAPYYYDTRYYRGDRRVYYARGNGYYNDDRYGRAQPTHGYKERTGGRDDVPPARGLARRGAPPVSRGTGTTTPVSRDGDAQQEPRVTRPERQRPTFERRPTESPSSREERPRVERPRAEPRRESPPVRREEPRSEPRREAPAARAPRESAPSERPSRVRSPSE
jgi:hypothetical protein